MSSTEAKDGGDNYMFARDNAEAYRLNYGHFHHVSCAGFLLHPDIPVPTREEGIFRVADLGGGTGIWSIFLARQLRAKTDIKIDCVDISSDLFPTKPWQTPDVTYHVHDCFKPFPAEFHGQYDVVHVRFWLTFVDNEHVPGLLAEFLKLLKPQGYLQWHEPCFGDADVVKMDKTVSAPLNEAQAQFFRDRTKNKGWPAYLSELMNTAGYDKVAVTVYRIPDELRPIGRPYSTAGSTQNKTISPEEKQRAVDSEEEFRKGVAIDQPWYVTVGRARA